ncbi:MAG: ABC transporter permease [Phycisphaerae bacterium]|nr:ABC transporter permease [Phycisphaerae bacterium]MCZ2399925.1 ABC transporter permease [Phycisphaerae bacterium]NUQ49131.1 ABC transporter permease [Phycisphaerae bacterium]
MLIRTLLSRELILLGLADLRAHKLRSLLTALGMIFGVGAVVCMLSIGEGASAEQLESIRLLGSQNIILRSIEPPASQEARSQNQSVKEYGLKRADVERLASLPHVRDVVLLREVAETIELGSRKFEGVVVGTTENIFDVVNIEVARGRPLSEADSTLGHKVCVIGSHVAEALFPGEDPLGRTINVVSISTGPIPYAIVGVLRSVTTAGNPAKGLGARNVNNDVYIPLATVDLRYGDLRVKWGRGTRDIRRVQFSDVYLAIDQQDQVLELSKLVDAALSHERKERDFTITVPLELLQQAEQAKRLWQTVLGSIAGISLVVGGIGIMNIMLASVTERTREIGIRRALGAKRYHITAQFLVETVLLSVSGGVIGILVGILFALLVTVYSGFPTIIAWWGVLLSFLVSAIVGISFGLYPARAAAALDPIEALRHE